MPYALGGARPAPEKIFVNMQGWASNWTGRVVKFRTMYRAFPPVYLQTVWTFVSTYQALISLSYTRNDF